MRRMPVLVSLLAAMGMVPNALDEDEVKVTVRWATQPPGGWIDALEAPVPFSQHNAGAPITIKVPASEGRPPALKNNRPLPTE